MKTLLTTKELQEQLKVFTTPPSTSTFQSPYIGDAGDYFNDFTEVKEKLNEILNHLIPEHVKDKNLYTQRKKEFEAFVIRMYTHILLNRNEEWLKCCAFISEKRIEAVIKYGKKAVNWVEETFEANIVRAWHHLYKEDKGDAFNELWRDHEDYDYYPSYYTKHKVMFMSNYLFQEKDQLELQRAWQRHFDQGIAFIDHSKESRRYRAGIDPIAEKALKRSNALTGDPYVDKYLRKL